MPSFPGKAALRRLYLYFDELARNNGLAVRDAQRPVINQAACKAAFAGNLDCHALRDVHAVIAKIPEKDCSGGDIVVKYDFKTEQTTNAAALRVSEEITVFAVFERVHAAEQGCRGHCELCPARIAGRQQGDGCKQVVGGQFRCLNAVFVVPRNAGQNARGLSVARAGNNSRADCVRNAAFPFPFSPAPD